MEDSGEQASPLTPDGAAACENGAVTLGPRHFDCFSCSACIPEIIATSRVAFCLSNEPTVAFATPASSQSSYFATPARTPGSACEWRCQSFWRFANRAGALTRKVFFSRGWRILQTCILRRRTSCVLSTSSRGSRGS
jgi:hypothetical protein